MNRDQLIVFLSRAVGECFPDLKDEIMRDLEQRLFMKCLTCKRPIYASKVDVNECRSCIYNREQTSLNALHAIRYNRISLIEDEIPAEEDSGSDSPKTKSDYSEENEP